MLWLSIMTKKIIAYISSLFIFCLIFLLSYTVVNIVFAYSDFYPPSIPEDYLPIFCIVTLLFPIFIGFIVTRIFIKWYEGTNKIKLNWFPKNRSIKNTIFGLYLLTAFVGIPSIQSHNTKWAVEEYKRINTGENQRVWKTHPYIGTYLAIPILPFIVISYHEYQLDGLYGLGSWDIQLWYFTGVKRITRITLWVS